MKPARTKVFQTVPAQIVSQDIYAFHFLLFVCILLVNLVITIIITNLAIKF